MSGDEVDRLIGALLELDGDQDAFLALIAAEAQVLLTILNSAWPTLRKGR